MTGIADPVDDGAGRLTPAVDNRAVLGLALNGWFLVLIAYLQILPAGRFHVLGC